MNKVILMGRLARDPELRYTQNGTAVCNFTLAVNRRFQKQGEEPKVDFIPVVVWGKQAEFCEKHFRKGRQVAVVGRIQVDSWEQEGKRQYKTTVVAEETYFADSKPQEQGAQEREQVEKEDSKGEGFSPLEDTDDELPF